MERSAMKHLCLLHSDSGSTVGSFISWITLTNSLYKLAFNLFKQREDKEWGLVDCISFIVMQDRAITDALTADTHFQQAGFRALLRD
ncbi:hypothetical protein CK510_26755 [Brunnivagina elsteri CCALA 953]|uniref:PIN domain-containing protein n=1 Tax=Brunnivagina elsteri CCALA 953 TaxID=987040 RepID=A0A2A2TBB7_9CYAN|nr:hypothetical protein CK510_26755 [Calothrix elsteri CCALA 953]